MTLDAFLEKHRLDETYKATALKWFNPLATAIYKHYKSAEQPFYIGLNGCQGSGKSTLSDYLDYILTNEYGLKVIVCSLDDFYLPHAKRQQLAKTVHPLLATRGVPGTHDTELLEQVLLHIQQNATMAPLAIPRFDKSTDDPFPQAQWPRVALPVNVVIFEGWCWGVRTQDEDQLLSPVNALEAEEDNDGVWRRYVNTQLQHHYEPLYALMDCWIMLKAPGFDTVAKWREEQESKLRASLKGSAENKKNRTMNKAEIHRFIQYFQRLTEHGLNTLPAQCDCVFHLDENRKIHDATYTGNGVFE